MSSRFVVLLMAGAAFATAADVRVVEEIAVKVNGDIITRGELTEQMRELEMYLRQEQKLSGPALQSALQEQSKDMLREKIDELLLVQKGKDLDLKVDADVIKRLGQAKLEAMKADPKLADEDKFEAFIHEQTGLSYEDYKQKLTNQILTSRVVSNEVSSRIAVPEAEMKKYYDDHQAEFTRKAQVFLSQIIISTEGKTPEQVANAEKKAKEIADRARKGEKFTELVSAYSDDPETAKAGGQLPPAEKGQLRADLDKLVFSAKKGTVLDPIKVDAPIHGFLILKVEERYEEGLESFEEAKDQIQDVLARPKMQPKFREYLTKLRQDAFLQIKDGYVDTGAAPGKDTSWHDVTALKPQTTTKEEVAAHLKQGPIKLMGFVPIPGTHKKVSDDTDTTPSTAKDESGKNPQGPQTAVSADKVKVAKAEKPPKPKVELPPLPPIKQ
ncbi:MAG: peptidylprolyl isomerase [Candidatus Sulfopaludibacter sp.]|nr:peptidylprolyl isomerase [Candidatus Sulfopaludibacter sp.]